MKLSIHRTTAGYYEYTIAYEGWAVAGKAGSLRAVFAALWRNYAQWGLG
jgi:hypothetical protein